MTDALFCTLEVSGIDFDAGHAIPWHTKCGRLHGHTYNVRVNVSGYTDPVTHMVLDFGIIKAAVKAVADEFDHRFIVNRAHTSSTGSTNDNETTVTFGVSRSLKAPLDELVLLDGDSTVENICAEFAARLGKRLHVENTLSVYVSEGNAKGAEVTIYHEETGATAITSEAIQTNLPGIGTP